MTLTLTILGCGSSAGVPRPALGWGACDPNNPKNRRRRCSLMVEHISNPGTTRIVIDTSPDLREQLIDAKVDHIDAVFLTHEHADQTHGMDDLRSVVLHMRRRIPVYFNQSTAKDIMARFSYCFISPEGSDYPPILTRHSIESGESQTILGKGGAVTLSAFIVQHGQIPSLGYRIGNAAYTPDLNDIPRESWGALENLDLWIVDGLRYTNDAKATYTEMAFAEPAWLRSRNFWILPVEVFGIGPNTTTFGVLKPDMCVRQKAMISASVALAPSFNSTNAQGTSPHFGSGLATTAANSTAGCL